MAETMVFTIEEKRLDFSEAAGFQERLLDAVDAGGGTLVIDFGAVEYIASVGLRALILASKKSKAAGGTLVVARLQPLVREIFEISRFDQLLTVTDNVAEALAAAGGRTA
jgi:anti-anti-sigma factor